MSDQQNILPIKTNYHEGQNLEFGPWLSQASILIVDDEPGIRNFLVKMLKPRCKEVVEASNTKEASLALDKGHFDVVILDNIMTGQSGVEWLVEQRTVGFFADAILITAYADLETAIRALQAGAVDFVLKPFRSNQILNAVARCLDRIRLRRENFLLRYELEANSKEDSLHNKLLGSSGAIADIRNTLSLVAPMPTSVLITGESGSGKEIAARTLHSLSDRADQPFVPVNCAAIAENRIESEFFGHLNGAESETTGRREGLFSYASGGTLFLDEIGELPLSMQSKLLRAIEDKKIRPIGSEREVPVNVRFIFATNADLPLEVEEGRFRSDLFYRLNIMHIAMPPLRERRGDIKELAEMFVEKFSRELGVQSLPLTKTVLDGLSNMDWPGNVRELRNFIERSLILGAYPTQFQTKKASQEDSKSERMDKVEQRHILSVLEASNGNRAEAARRLGISRKTIDRKCAQWCV